MHFSHKLKQIYICFDKNETYNNLSIIFQVFTLIKATEQRETHENCFNIKIQYLFNVMFVLSKINSVRNWKLELVRNK